MKYKINFDIFCNKDITKCGKVWIFVPNGIHWNDFILKSLDVKIDVLTSILGQI